jgi:hypothetical protein
MKAMLSLIAALIVLAIPAFAQAAPNSSAPSGTKPYVAYFDQSPTCVKPGTINKFRVRFVNLGTSDVIIQARIMGVYYPGPTATYAYGLRIAHGTDHLVGPADQPFWLLSLTPKQSVTRTLATLVNKQNGVINDTEPYTVDIQIIAFDAKGDPIYEEIVLATPHYCGSPVIWGGMK